MFNDMNADQIGAMAAGQKDAAGPTMMFAQVSSSSSEASRGARTGDGGALSKEETDKLGGRLAQVGSFTKNDTRRPGGYVLDIRESF